MASKSKVYLFEQEKISSAVFSLCLPTIASNLVMVVYSLADTYFVGALNNPVQSAAVSLAAPVLLVFNAVNNLFGVGASSMMSRALGRNDMKTLHRSSAFGFYGALFFSVLFSLVCFVFQTPLLHLLGAAGETMEPTRSYLVWTVFIGASFAILNVVMAYLVRAEGSTLHASIGTISGCLLNIILDPVFILPGMLNMGAQGAALATMISNLFAVLYFFVYLFFRRKTTCVSISPRDFTLDRKIVLGVFAVGVPASIQNLLNVLGQMIMNNLAAGYGTVAVAAMGIATRASMVGFYVAMGISQGVMPLVGYTYTAGMKERFNEAIAFTAKISFSILIVMTLVYELFPSRIVSLFIQHPETVETGAHLIRGLALAIAFLAADFLAVGVFQAVGKGRNALIMAFTRKLVLEIPFMFILRSLFGLYGLGYSQMAAEMVMSVFGMVLLRRFMAGWQKELACNV